MELLNITIYKWLRATAEWKFLVKDNYNYQDLTDQTKSMTAHENLCFTSNTTHGWDWLTNTYRCNVLCQQPCFNVTCILGRALGNSQRQDSWQTAILLYRNLLNIRERVHQHFAPQIPCRYFWNFILSNKQLERPHLYDTICERSAVPCSSNSIPNLTLKANNQLTSGEKLEQNTNNKTNTKWMKLWNNN